MNHYTISTMQGISSKSLFPELICLLSTQVNIPTLTTKSHFSPKQLSSQMLLCLSFFHIRNLEVILNSFVFFHISLETSKILHSHFLNISLYLPASYHPKVPRPSSSYRSYLSGFPWPPQHEVTPHPSGASCWFHFIVSCAI